MPLEFKNGTVPRLYEKDNLNSTWVSSVSCMWLPLNIYELVFLLFGGGRVSGSHCYPVTIRLRLISGSYFQKSKFRSPPFLMYKVLVFFHDSLLRQPDFQVPRMGKVTWEKNSQVDGQLALIDCQAKADNILRIHDSISTFVLWAF